MAEMRCIIAKIVKTRTDAYVHMIEDELKMEIGEDRGLDRAG